MTGSLADLVPAPDKVISIGSLMGDDDGQQSQQSQQAQHAQQGEAQRAQQVQSGDEQANKRASVLQPIPQENQNYPDSDDQEESREAPAGGWVSFGSQPQEAQSGQQEEAKVGQATISEATPGQATEGQSAQMSSAQISSGASAQQAGLSGGSSDADDVPVSQRIDATNQLLAQKDGEIAYWKQVCMNALRQAQALNIACEENKQRGDELEQHLQDLLQQQQKEKEQRLSKLFLLHFSFWKFF